MYILMSAERGMEMQDSEQEHSQKLTRRSFEGYIRTAKPYLKTDLKITDLCGPLHTNRSYLSNFINATYGMSFSRFINDCRLYELEQMLRQPPSSGQSNIDLILQAGFGSYDSYRRTKKLHERETTLSV